MWSSFDSSGSAAVELILVGYLFILCYIIGVLQFAGVRSHGGRFDDVILDVGEVDLLDEEVPGLAIENTPVHL